MDDNSLNIQWYPGHMTKARRMMLESVKMVDAVCEILDARIPLSSRNPDLNEIIGVKPRMIIMNRVDLADPDVTKLWGGYYKRQGLGVLETDSKSGKGVKGFSQAVRELLREKLAAYAEKGQAGRGLRVMVAGIPNVGKSTFINKVAGRKAAEASDRPGVTRGKQWISVDKGLELLDTPGLLWPKFEDREMGENLAFTGAINDQTVDIEALAAALLSKLKAFYPTLITARYKIDVNSYEKGWEMLEAAARKRGFLISGGEVDTRRMAAILLDEFRGGVIGRISLERP